MVTFVGEQKSSWCNTATNVVPCYSILAAEAGKMNEAVVQDVEGAANGEEVGGMMEVDICKESTDAYDACDEHEEDPPSGQNSNNSSNDDEEEGDGGEEDDDAIEKADVTEQNDDSVCFSSVSLGEKEMSVMHPTTMADVSRKIMFNKYARAVPSAQESCTTHGESNPASASSNAQHPASLSILPAPATAMDNDDHTCCSLSCQEHTKWKDERIHALQKALDHMVDAMAIQQRDMAAQRAFLARQSEQLTRLSMTLHQEKLTLQIEKERFQKAGRGSCSTPTASSSSRPPTPSTSSSRSSTPRASKKIGAVFSTFSSSSSRTESSRRCRVSSIGEHAVVAPTEMVYPTPAASSFSSTRSASTSHIASILHIQIPPSNADVSMTKPMGDTTDLERSISLSALEIRSTQPVTSSSSDTAHRKMETPSIQMSDVNLLDASPVRFGSRSATNCFVQDRQKGVASTSVASSSSSPRRAASSASPSSAPTASVESSKKKPSLGDRFRSIRWKS